MIITVDGPGGSGKSTVSRLVARRSGLPYLNSGFIYRAVTVLVLEDGGDFDDRERVSALIQGMELCFEEEADRTRVVVGGRDITDRLKAPDVTPQIYHVANDGHYRSLLVDLQRRCASPDGVVAEGRDMGTVIFPGADYKFYLDASAEVRARRQLGDLEAAGHQRDYETILAEVVQRDRHDTEREDAPLRVPDDATVILTDDLTIEQVVEKVLSTIRPPVSSGGGPCPSGGGS